MYDVSVLHNFVQDEYTGVPNNVDKVKFAFIGSIDKNKGVDIALRACVENIVNNPFQLEKMGMNARNKYLETSTGEIYRKNVLQIINDFLSENKDEK